MPLFTSGVFASENVSRPAMGGVGTSPETDGGGGRASGVGVRTQTNTATLMTKVTEALRGYVMENWLPFTWPTTARFLPPSAPVASFASPVDLYAGEHITRFGTFPSIERPFPYPYQIGAVSGFLPMLDAYSRAFAYARNAYGPGVETPMQVPWQITYPSLQKVTG